MIDAYLRISRLLAWVQSSVYVGDFGLRTESCEGTARLFCTAKSNTECTFHS